jgi:putative mRNA 3-end processing factor
MPACSSAIDLLRLTDKGLYCPAGEFYVDPWQPVHRAVITHAHSDHARWGCQRYLTTNAGEAVLRARMGADASIESIPYGQQVAMNGVTVSLHPAGHILGSAQVRVEAGGEVWVVSGDYKVEGDATCAPFEPVRCHTFITESTFGLPVYRWPRQSSVLDDICAWWRSNQQQGRASVLFAYALGKAQRIVAGVDAEIGPIYTHSAVEKMNAAYRASGIALPATIRAKLEKRPPDWSRALVIAPPSAEGTTWMRRFGAASTAFASGWMQIRGARRRRAVDRGFVFSDHADWPGLLDAIKATQAERVLVTHGYSEALARWVRERGLAAETLRTRFQGERDDMQGDDV